MGPNAAGAGPKYEINVEGKLHLWDQPNISVPEIRDVGGLPSELGDRGRLGQQH